MIIRIGLFTLVDLKRCTSMWLYVVILVGSILIIKTLHVLPDCDDNWELLHDNYAYTVIYMYCRPTLIIV